jgi:outer membrane biosynthesis protein TonB
VTRREFSPALAGSALLHLLVAVLLMVNWHWNRDLKIGSVVPVTIVANAPDTDMSPAVQAPQAQAAATETPVPDAPPEVTPPPPKPQPQPKPTPPVPKPTPAPTPTPKPPPPKPAPAKPQTAVKPAPRSLDLDALAASISKSSKPSSAVKGPTRPASALQARVGSGTGVSAAAMNGMVAELERLWNPNCDVEGGRDVMVKVTVTFGTGGGVVGQPRGQIMSAVTPVSQVGLDRAIRAVNSLRPSFVPREVYNEPVVINFPAREACARQ